MNEREVNALVNQLALCYGYNKRLRKPLRLALCGLEAASLISAGGQSICSMLDKWNARHWLLHRREAGAAYEAFASERLVFLSADSPNLLDGLHEDTIYCIGGLVVRDARGGQQRRT